eukprot:CAMPEP_0206135526 /NCGR_PEP_ID=MMETSP1473-20131121/797_1 /ASSEMBLY_ACC=CAM_ASM_001109 /TAXON_ID=1461547 /ORGANISM="Stichococcus sp, Strain RCC1054" /LENGTH=337 /DNA_ID=CAMNT_0053527435 /DNA_START=2056 /DNA_END=3069 /DNA_ORIENTATION=-
MVDLSVLEEIQEAQKGIEERAQGPHPEFNEFPFGENSDLAPTSVATAPCNKNKNRYNNVLPFDHNLVVLPPLAQISTPGSSDDPNNYINASCISDSWLHGNTAEPEMLVTQGPLPETVPEFWRLVALLPEPRRVVMLTNEVENTLTKCAKYLPPRSNHPLKFQGGAVTLLSEKKFNRDITRRTLGLELYGLPVIKVEHYQHHKWPDHGIPNMRLMSELVYEMGIKAEEKAVPLVHCSAGVGRTGCFAVHLLTMRRLNYLLHKEPSNGGWSKAMEVGETVKMLRHQRGRMVQTEDQFKFCYGAVLAELNEGLRHLKGAQRGSGKWEGCLAPLLNKRNR